MEETRRESYPSDLTDEQWEEIAPLYTGMRNCTWNKRELTDAVLYLVDSEPVFTTVERCLRGYFAHTLR